MTELKPCPFCGGEIEERGGTINFVERNITLDLKCKNCGTIFKFKSKFENNPHEEVAEKWNRRVENDLR